MAKNELLRLKIDAMDCAVEVSEIEALFKDDKDFRIHSSNCMNREMMFEVLTDTANEKELFQTLEKAGFPAKRLDENAKIAKEFLIYIEEMDCPVERAQIEAAFEKDTSFAIMSFDMTHRTVRFIAKEIGADEKALLEKLEKMGLPGKAQSQEKKITPAPEESHFKHILILLVAFVFAGISEFLEIRGTSSEEVILALSLIAIGLSGIKTLWRGAINLLHLRFNMNTLMAVAVFGAVIIGQYPEAAMVMVLYEIGEEIEDRTLANAQKSIRNLLEKAPSVIEVFVNGTWIKTGAESIQIGTIYRAAPGQMLVADGVVLDGVSAIDVSSLTGESIPETALKDSEVRSGTIALDGTLTIRATCAASDSTAARITRAIESAQQKKAKIERFIDRFARYYTPAIFAASLLLGVGTVLVTGVFDKETVYRSLVLLVIGCPCALVISTPVALLAAMTVASRNGVFVRGSVPMEAAATLKTAVFDKTGTLTVGKPVFKAIRVLGKNEATQAWIAAAALAKANKHPLSQALAKACDATLSIPKANDLHNLPGYGVEARVHGAMMHLTNRSWLKENHLLSSEANAAFDTFEQEGHTALALSDLFGAIAVFAFSDTPKAGVDKSIAQLKKEGVDVWLLTGDNEKSAAAIAHFAGITNVRAKLLPQDKLNIISQLDAKAPTAMIGDGINDAPALARARLGIAMGAMGTDTAIESADVVLMNDDIGRVAWLKRLSQATHRTIAQNITFALGVKALFAIAAITGYATMWMAVFADTGVCLLVVAWALRLMRFEKN